MTRGCLYLVSVGPGQTDYVSEKALAALRHSQMVVSYDLYLNWVKQVLTDQELYCPPLTKERERAQAALAAARQGKRVALVSSGDIGVYAMASLAFELMEESDDFQVEVIPGTTAATACASIIGAPLSHDFATLSLSDLLCPFQWIEERAKAVAQADLCLAMYNVQSEKRRTGVYKILDILIKGGKSPDTLCGVVKNAYRPGQESYIATLSELTEKTFDMFTTIIVGNRFTRRKRDWIFTPRGYMDWEEQELESPREDAVWVFSGTSDGNEAALAIRDSNRPVVVSVASDYGAKLNQAALAGHDVQIVAGRLGQEKRKTLLKTSRCKAVIDATHPHAEAISLQLNELCSELQIPYLRLERPKSDLPEQAYLASDCRDAARQAIATGKRIFLATGARDLETFLQADGAANREWFLRIIPDPEIIDKAVKLGIKPKNICAMQGPFSSQFNDLLMREWQVDCLVTKDSGARGGLQEKIEAAGRLQIPIIVIKRPAPHPGHGTTFQSAAAIIETLNKLHI
ncbi:MAG: precorrin-3B C(17)-methyltransferase [Candidatus Obscuribacter sp.]|nr:precorrin-3B C(17)-methyltransferase [Candidatus Obscuribacter sp.]